MPSAPLETKVKGERRIEAREEERSPEEEEEAPGAGRLPGCSGAAARMEPNVRFWITERQVRPGPGAAGGGEGRAAWSRRWPP